MKQLDQANSVASMTSPLIDGWDEWCQGLDDKERIDFEIRREELRLQREELQIKRAEMSVWRSPLFVPALVAIIGGVFTYAVGSMQKNVDVQSSYILEALKRKDAQETTTMLSVLVQAGLVTDERLKQSISKLFASPNAQPSAVAVSSASLPPGPHTLQPSTEVVTGNYLLKTGRQDLAVAQWRAGADKGDPIAEGNVAFAYENGIGVPQDLKMAAEFYKKAADHGNPTAQYKFGTYLEAGTGGVPQNLKEAIRMYQLAADQHVPAAATKLQQLGSGASR